MIKKILLGLTLVLSLFNFLMAGTVGKIAGIVTDSETKEPLMGVNIFLQGTSLGAATDEDGYFVILNIPPGNYTLQAAYIGYADFIVHNVKVTMNLTAPQNIVLTSKIIFSEAVVVEAKRPVVVRDISNSQLNIDAQVIQELPIQNVSEVLTLQAGIQMGTEGILVRGGGASQTLFMVDGLSMNDERSNIPYTTMSLSSIEEIQVQTGGFTAEYGDLRSGLVNVVTREGKNEKYQAFATINYSPIQKKQNGPSLYSADSYFNRPFMDPAVCWTGTNNGAWDKNMQKQYPTFEGWNAVSEKTFTDNIEGNELTPEGAKRLFEWQRRRQGDIDKPDYLVDLGVGGPVPFVSKYLGNLRFFATHVRNRDMFIFPLSRDSFSENTTRFKLTSNINDNMKLSLSSMYGETRSASPYNWKTTPTGRVLRSESEIANLANSAAVLYMPGYYSPADIFRKTLGLKFTHILNSTTFYDVSLQFMSNRYNTFQTSERDTSKIYEPVPGYFVDEAPYGYWGSSSSAIDGMSLGGWMNLGRDKTVNSTTTFTYDITSQYNQKNMFKAGFKIVYNDFNVKSTTESPSMSTWTRSMVYRINPYRVGAYLQDKLEYEGFIANVGLRLDVSNSNTEVYLLDAYDKYYKAGYGNSIESDVPTEKSKVNIKLSPRLGISHPITDNSKLYFNYGHYYSEPASSYRFRIQRESNGFVTYMGNPNLNWEKTIAYELGFEQNLYGFLLLKVAAYYKDVTEQPGWIYYQNVNASAAYYKSSNNNYADIRGFEVTLTKNMGRWVSGFINYTYDVSSSGYFGLRKEYQDPNEQRIYLSENPYQPKPHPRPYARLNVNFHSPDEYGPQMLSFYPLGSWNLNILANWKAGRYATYNPNKIPGIVDNVRYRDYYNLDLRLAKTFSFASRKIQLYMDVDNVFNVKRFNYAGFSDSYDRENYLQSLCFDWETGDRKGNDKIGDYRPAGVAFDPLEANPDNDPEVSARNAARKKDKSYIDMPNIKALTFLYPRFITFGLKLNF